MAAPSEEKLICDKFNLEALRLSEHGLSKCSLIILIHASLISIIVKKM
jgi:hypothetical protein